MSVVPLTVIGSLCLVFTFALFFYREHAAGRGGSAEHDSLLPLAEEGAKVATSPVRRGCGCEDGSRPPCAGCLRGLHAGAHHSHHPHD